MRLEYIAERLESIAMPAAEQRVRKVAFDPPGYGGSVPGGTPE
jgi:hypothetical protein